MHAKGLRVTASPLHTETRFGSLKLSACKHSAPDIGLSIRASGPQLRNYSLLQSLMQGQGGSMRLTLLAGCASGRWWAASWLQ